MRHKAKSGRTLCLELNRLIDYVATAKADGNRDAERKYGARLDAFKNGLSTIERERLMDYARVHEPAESASAILLGA